MQGAQYTGNAVSYECASDGVFGHLVRITKALDGSSGRMLAAVADDTDWGLGIHLLQKVALDPRKAIPVLEFNSTGGQLPGIASETIAAGDYLKPAASGKIAVATEGQTAYAVCDFGGDADEEILFTMLLNPKTVPGS